MAVPKGSKSSKSSLPHGALDKLYRPALVKNKIHRRSLFKLQKLRRNKERKEERELRERKRDQLGDEVSRYKIACSGGGGTEI